jgi:hypothetical protein
VKKIKENGMGGTYRTHGKDEKGIEHFSRKYEGKSDLGNLGVDGGITLKWIIEE